MRSRPCVGSRPCAQRDLSGRKFPILDFLIREKVPDLVTFLRDPHKKFRSSEVRLGTLVKSSEAYGTFRNVSAFDHERVGTLINRAEANVTQ